MSRIDDAFEEHRGLVEQTRADLHDPLEQAVGVLADSLGAGHKVLVCGNGGSAAAAQHFVAELVGRYAAVRRPLRALALTGDAVTVTALANDEGFETVFARQVDALAEPGDVLVALSCSGESPNVVEAVASARRRGCAVVVMTGAGGGALARHADLSLTVPSKSVARIQEMHDLCLHVLAEGLEHPLAVAGPGPDTSRTRP